MEKMTDAQFKLENVGGQAVLEGVMMRTPHFWAVAVRQPDGQIITQDHLVKSVSEKFSILKKPILRGVTALIENMIIGFKALNFSANISMGEEEEKISNVQIAISFLVAMIMVVVLFMAVPYLATGFVRRVTNSKLTFTIVEGAIRISIFIGYIYLISTFKDIKRVFQYHGAEHKVVNAFEHKEELSNESAAKYSTVHLRCGTNFVIIVFIIAVVVFSFLPTDNIYLRLGGKILLGPIIAGIAYEIIRRASKSNSRFIKAILRPGLLLQKVTTREPDESQVEVAVVSLKRALELERNYVAEVAKNTG